MKTRWMPIVMILVLAVSVLIALPASAANGGHTNKTLAPTVTTDQADYPPGATVYITGAGFQAGETVQFQVLRIDIDENTARNTSRGPVTADANGGFQPTWLVTADELRRDAAIDGDGVEFGL